MKKRLSACFSASLASLMAACSPSGAEPDPAAYEAEIMDWRANRLERLIAPDGYLNQTGLFWLEPGEHSFGVGPENDIVFPGDGAARIGRFIVTVDGISMQVEPDVDVYHQGMPVREIAMVPDTAEEPVAVTHNSLAWMAIERQGRYAIRLRDYEHRLDKDTSGLLLVAKTLTSHTALVRLLAERAIDRHYLAVCNGELTGGGTIREPIGRHPVDRKRQSVQSKGKPAVTHYTVRERFKGFTYVDVKLETGRTHQIRVHFAHRRHSLVGDPVYGGRLALPKGASEELIQVLRHFKRQALHATRLAFRHPVSEEALEFEVPPPADFRGLIDAMRRSTDNG